MLKERRVIIDSRWLVSPVNVPSENGALRSRQNTEYSRSAKMNHPVTVAVVALVVVVESAPILLNFRRLAAYRRVDRYTIR